MFKQYRNKVEAAIMTSDVEEGLDLRDVSFTGQAVLADGGSMLYIHTKITDDHGYVSTDWFALDDNDELVYSDFQPDGLHFNTLGV